MASYSFSFSYATMYVNLNSYIAVPKPNIFTDVLKVALLSSSYSKGSYLITQPVTNIQSYIQATADVDNIQIHSELGDGSGVNLLASDPVSFSPVDCTFQTISLYDETAGFVLWDQWFTSPITIYSNEILTLKNSVYDIFVIRKN